MVLDVTSESTRMIHGVVAPPALNGVHVEMVFKVLSQVALPSSPEIAVFALLKSPIRRFGAGHRIVSGRIRFSSGSRSLRRH